MIQRVIAIGFLGYHFTKTVVCRLFRLKPRGLAEFKQEYRL